MSARRMNTDQETPYTYALFLRLVEASFTTPPPELRTQAKDLLELVRLAYEDGYAAGRSDGHLPTTTTTARAALDARARHTEEGAKES